MYIKKEISMKKDRKKKNGLIIICMAGLIACVIMACGSNGDPS